MIYTIYSAQEMEDFAFSFAANVQAGDVLCLAGDLGAGKTVFTRGLVRGLHCGESVTSPTFALMHIYEGGRLPVYHYDLYRLNGAYDLESVGCEEYFSAGGVCILEWPERANNIVPANATWITIKADYEKGENYREVSIHENTGN
ncbi:MAG: tRNA (adenosine(37)-N6)-threonylcarbamoyltransferase complex ATPase subunit type 1 TsaE [Defluviitaleaceae bacterium]|nr:tRNA (adenosine(37)-N6)-threonylcarbamoyltransferase complex ATPase subunit type 1 TsaE [Defluviitaleaceae bacterium]MCL2273599.1 tRNA (adenosine(37)-N6)-threonylcarbamoyltransferase complex ATPase subunit type 1 TsaE [Defluviitaleaceae bacterium]